MFRAFSSTATKVANVARARTLRAAALLQRPPITMEALSDVEANYLALRDATRRQNSRGILSFTASAVNDDAATEQAVRAAASEAEEALKEQSRHSATLRFGAETDAKVDNILRLPDRKLYLVVRDRQTQQWTLPWSPHSGQLKEDGPLSETALKALAWQVDLQTLQQHQTLFPVGPHPITYWTEENSDVYVYPILYRSGKITPNPESGCDAYAWLTRDEMQTYLSPEKYESLQDILDV